MNYTEEMFVKFDNETKKMLHFLQQCKFSGSWDTKIDLNVIIKMISNYQFIVNSLRQKNKELEEEIKILLDEKK